MGANQLHNVAKQIKLYINRNIYNIHMSKKEGFGTTDLTPFLALLPSYYILVDTAVELHKPSFIRLIGTVFFFLNAENVDLNFSVELSWPL